MAVVSALFAGLVFGLGLIVSGMADPAKVLGFLDLAARWDPSLALVMLGAIAVGLLAFTAAGRRTRPLLDLPMRIASSNDIAGRLIGGGLLFGVGWAIAGVCPGPAACTRKFSSGGVR